jgi:hypothetical protein
MEMHVDPIQGHDGGQRGAVALAGHQVAGRDLRTSGTPGDRRADFRELQVQPGSLDRGAGRMHVGFGLRRRGTALIQFLQGYRLRFRQFFRPCRFGLASVPRASSRGPAPPRRGSVQPGTDAGR